MNLKIWMPLAAAVVTGGAAAYLGMDILSRPQPPAPVQQVALEEFVIAARSLPAGARLQLSDLRTIRIEAATMQETAFATTSELVGRVLAVPIIKGQPLAPDMLAHIDSVPGLAAVLPAGHRAITLQTDRYDGLDGFLQAGVHVDVLATLRDADGSMMVRSVVQNVRVLAVNGLLAGQEQSIDNQRASLRENQSVTLLVTPEQAAAINLAADSGNPRLTLRAGGDHVISAFLGMTMAELRGQVSPDLLDPYEPFPLVRSQETTVQLPAAGQPATATAAPAPEAPEPRRHVVEIIRGGVVSREPVISDRTESPKPVRKPEHAVANTDTRAVD